MVSFYISYIVLWGVVGVLFVSVFLLYRQCGALLFRDSSVRFQQGPETDHKLAPVYTRDVHGLFVELGEGSAMFQFIFFASSKCPVCKDALPSLQTFAANNETVTETVMICRGHENDVRNLSNTLVPTLKVVHDSKGAIGRRLRIGATPFALLIDCGGVVRAKGAPVSDREFAWFADRMAEGSVAQGAEIGIHMPRRSNHAG